MDLVEIGAAGGAHHPWEEARSRFFLRVLADARIPAPGETVLDVGAGDAWFARELSARFPGLADVVCWDVGYSDEILASPAFAPSPPVRFSRVRPREPFALLLLLDVLEHVEDDAPFLASLVRDNLVAGGHALVSVPAWPALHGSHDDRLRHHRRYTPVSARRLLSGAGLDVLGSGGLFSSLLPARALQIACERLVGRPARGNAGRWTAPRAVTSMIRAALSCDARVSLAGTRLGISVPGLSWWALCRKTSR